jgi:hypothetical protein
MNEPSHISAGGQPTPLGQSADKASQGTGEISAKQAAILLQFLQRTQMQGAEMPAYVDVFNSLSAIVAAANGEDGASLS